MPTAMWEALMSTDSATTEQSSFWGKQIPPRPTAGQIAFDLAFGIALPVICLYFDPFVLQADIGEPLLGRYAVSARVAISLGLLSLSAWMLIRWPPALMAGLLAGGAIFATLLGLVLLPFSIMGLLMFIGVLGFSPFVTAFVFWRNAVAAYRRTHQSRINGRVLIPVAVGLALYCAGPCAMQWYVTRAVEMVKSHHLAEAAQGLSVLKRFGVFANYDLLVFAYRAEKDAERRQRLAEAYKELTGTEIGHRLARLD
jgi:hypothetical protein